MTAKPAKDAAKGKLPEERRDGKGLERFTAFVRKIVAVPKDKLREEETSAKDRV